MTTCLPMSVCLCIYVYVETISCYGGVNLLHSCIVVHEYVGADGDAFSEFVGEYVGDAHSLSPKKEMLRVFQDISCSLSLPF